MKVVAYARVSTEQQVEEGVSIDAQLASIYRWAELACHTVVVDFRDSGISGSTTQRPGFQDAMDYACKHKAILAVYSLSRASRSVRDTYETLDKLKEAGAAFASVTEHIDTSTASGKLIFGVLAVFAQFEREIIAERTRTAMAHKKARGECVGYVPYGYRKTRDKRLEPDVYEMNVIDTIQTMRRAGASLRAIQASLRKMKMLNRKGHVFRLNTIAKLASSERSVV